MGTENGHIAGEVFDILEDRFSADRRREMQAHIETCPECAEVWRTARELHEDVLGRGARHLAYDRRLALAEAGSGTTTPEETFHLERCEVCAEGLRHLESLPDPPELGAESEPRAAPAPARDRRRYPLRGLLAGLWSRRGPAYRWKPRAAGWALGGLATAAAAIALVLVLTDGHGGGELARLADLTPLDVQWQRGGAGLARDDRLGLLADEAGDDEEAAQHLGRYTATHPDDPEAYLFLGSAYLLQREPEEARESLRIAADHTENDVLLQEIRWLLAQTRLLEGDAAAARRELDELIGPGLDRRADAQALEARIESTR